MKYALTVLCTILFFAAQAQRIKIGSQLEKAPTGDQYIPVTNPADGKQEYATVASILATSGAGDIVTAFDYDGDTLKITTDAGQFNVVSNAGSLHTTNTLTVGTNVYPQGTDIQTVLGDIATNTGGGTQTITRTGDDVTLSNGGGTVDVRDDDFSTTNEIQTISKSGTTVTLSNGGGFYTDAVDDLDANPNNELQTIGKSNNTVTMSDGGGSFDVLPSMTGEGAKFLTNDGTTASWQNVPSGEATTVTDGTTVDLTLTGTDITAEVSDASVTPAKLDRTYLESFTEVDGSITNEIELPAGGNANDLLQTDGSGNYTWVAPSAGAEATTVSNTSTVDLVLTGVDITATANEMTGATQTVAGTSGILPAPSAGDNLKVLRGDGVWVDMQSGGAMHTYQQGDAMIKSFGGASGDVTYSLSGNVGTVTIPAGVELMYIRVNENTTSIGSATDFILRIVDNNAVANQGTIATFMPPTTDFVKRDNLAMEPPTSTFPFVYAADNAPTPQVQITDYGTNQIDVTFKNVDSFTEWTAIANF